MNLDVRIITQALKQDRNRKVFTGSVFILCSITIVLTVLPDKPSATIFIGTIFCMLLAFTGLYFLLNGIFRYDVQKNHLLHLITEHPESVVWVYYHKKEQMPYGVKIWEITTLFICLQDRENIQLPMSATQANELMNLLRKRLHNATFGYSKHKEQLYHISPNLLSKEAAG